MVTYGTNIDGEVARNIVTPGSQTASALAEIGASEGIWQSSTVYTAGQTIRDPFGFTVSRISNGTSGSSYNAAEAALWKDVNGFTRPQRFGAVGDGSTDDTTAVQNALNAAVATGCALQLQGRYKTTAALSLPINSTSAFAIVGAISDSNPFGSNTINKASIESTGTAVFSQAAAGHVCMTLRDVNFRNTGANTNVVFTGVSLDTSTISGCTMRGYGWIFDSTSAILQVTNVSGNRFENLGGFCAGSIIDAFIGPGNYFNGDASRNATMVTGTVGTSVFMYNYIDFFKRVFDVVPGNADVRVEGNIFDYIWCTLGTSSSSNIGSWAFTGNTWHQCMASAALSFYPNADSDMTGTPWRAVDAGTNALTEVSLVGNNVVGVDGFIYAHGGCGALRESGNAFHQSTPSLLIDVKPTFYSTTPPDVILESLENFVNTATYAASQTIDWSTGGHQVLTLTGNVTSLAFSNGIKNRIYRLRVIQDGTGGRTWAGVSSAIKFGGQPNLSIAANAVDTFTFFYDGTNYYELSRTMNDGGTVYTPMGNAIQMSNNGQTDFFNGTSAYPFIRISPVFNVGPGTYGGIGFGRGNIAPDAWIARGNDNQPGMISGVPWLKKVTAVTLASNGAVSFNAYTAGDIYRVTMQANATSFTISLPATNTGYSQEIQVEFIQDATGSRTLASPASNIKWAGGSAPTLTTTANRRDIFRFTWDATASVWYETFRSMNVG